MSKRQKKQKGQKRRGIVNPRQPDAGEGCFPTQKLPPKWPAPPSPERHPHKRHTPNRRGR